MYIELHINHKKVNIYWKRVDLTWCYVPLIKNCRRNETRYWESVYMIFNDHNKWVLCIIFKYCKIYMIYIVNIGNILTSDLVFFSAISNQIDSLQFQEVLHFKEIFQRLEKHFVKKRQPKGMMKMRTLVKYSCKMCTFYLKRWCFS